MTHPNERRLHRSALRSVRQALAFALMMAMVFGMVPGTGVRDARAEDASPHTHDGITFTAWVSSDSLPTAAGNYYLTQDVTISGTWNVPGGTTNLCLNGHGIEAVASGSSYSAITVPSGVTLGLYDCGTVAHNLVLVTTALQRSALAIKHLQAVTSPAVTNPQMITAVPCTSGAR